jgi:NAD(P)-dependent dehydrogenase (short-subunit alcohol dehydrogenase family)
LLVNNAGTPGPFGGDWEVDADAWWECIEVSVRSAFICNQAGGIGVDRRHYV